MNTAKAYPDALQRLLRSSRYAQRLLNAEPALAEDLQTHHARPCTRAEMLDALAPIQDEDALASALRQLRKRVMLRVMLRDLAGLADLDEVMSTMTTLAEVAIQQAQRCISHVLAPQFGVPTGAQSGQPQELLVIGMGKLGGGELNVSSDIDLIFVYPEDGETSGPRQLSNHEYFARMGKRIIALINDLTGDGYVFRVDMRLRPYGDSGPLVMSFAALEEYLVSQGREWERYAWIKARVVSPPDTAPGVELMQLARPFVFRKYLDFGVFESMRKLHAQIRAEVARRDRGNNIKLGPGGIREIEFIAQVFQLIRGGREPGLRIRPTQKVLRQLAASGELGDDIVQRLDAAYVFLRNLEHRLQYLDDQQTQELPDDTASQAMVAESLGYADYPALLAELDPLRRFVSQQFEAVFGNRQADTQVEWWRDGMPQNEVAEALQRSGYRQADGLAERLLQLRNSGRYRQLPDLSRQRLDRLIPRLSELSLTTERPDQVFPRLLDLLENIARRASYLAFLSEFPQVLPRLVRIAAASRWACDYLTQHPILLDELLDAREFYTPPDWAALDAQLSERLADCGDDTERQIDTLHQFQQSQIFHLLAMDVQDLLPLETLSDHLSDLADLLLRHVLALCWHALPSRHRESPRFSIIAYGKLGGRELGYASDLDLIFLYDDEVPDAAAIYARLGKRISSMLSSYTASGRLYEVDLRLRPNGDSGLLVSSVAAFEEYQHQHAWVWEHQALTRARFCAGDPEIGAAFTRIRREVLQQPRDLAKLRTEIVAMRQRMHEGHPNPTGLFDIKHDSGGMVDIEFMVQFIILAHAGTHPALTENHGNLALLRYAGEQGLIEPQLAVRVADCYRELRRLQHRSRLDHDGPCRVESGVVDAGSARALWQAIMLDQGVN